MKLVVVTWRDSSHAHPQWKWLDDLKETGCHSIPVVISVGMVIQDDEEGITLAPTVGTLNDDQQVSGWFSIPRGCIDSVEELRDVLEEK